jgi:hypothetical protein
VKRLRITLVAVLALTAVLAIFSPAQASSQWLSFTVSCSNNNATDVATGANQLFVEVVPVGTTQVTFHFINVGPLASSITDVYFDDGSLLGIASITNGPGVDFSQFASPPDLPSGNTCSPPFNVTAGFLADSNPPAQPNGVNPGEQLDITFDLQSGRTTDDVVADLLNGALRIGIHVQGFANGGSEAFVNSPFTAVELSSFAAAPRRGQVTLNWSTGAETQNAGFNVYRATTPTGNRVRVNDLLLSAIGNEASGASYSHVDLPGYGTFYYWLEHVDYTGRSSLHGPIVAVVRAALQRPTFRPTLPQVTR